jgi:hypothetical protein
MEVAFPDWQKKPITAITKEMVTKRHTKLGTILFRYSSFEVLGHMVDSADHLVFGD